MKKRHLTYRLTVVESFKQLTSARHTRIAVILLLLTSISTLSQAQELVLDDAGNYTTLIDGAVYDSVRITGDDMEAETELNNMGNSYTGGTVVASGWLKMAGHYREELGVNSRIGHGDLTLAGGGLRGPHFSAYFNKRTLFVTAPSYLGVNVTIGDGQDIGTLSGSASLTKVDAGLSTVANANTNFTGAIIVQEGRLHVGSPSNNDSHRKDVLGGDLGQGGTIRGGDITVSNGASLTVGGNNSTTEINNHIYLSGAGYDTFNALDNGNRGGKITGTITMTGDTSIGNSGSHYDWYVTGSIVDNGHPHTLTLRSVATTTGGTRLQGDNTFSGDIVITRGYIRHEHANAFGANRENKTVTINAFDSGEAVGTTRLSMGTRDITVGTLVLNLLASSGSFATIQRTSSGVLRANEIVLQSGEFAALSDTSAYDWATSGDKTLVIDGNPTFSRNLGLTATGDGIVLRSGTFHAEPGTGAGQTGDTTIVPAVTLEGGVLEAGGHTQVFGALTLAGDAELDFAGGGGELRFSDSSVLEWDGALTVKNWSDDAAGVNRLFVGNTKGALTGEQLERMTTDEPRYQASQLQSGEIIFSPRSTVVVIR